MQKDELVEIVDVIATNWNIRVTPDKRKSLYETWWRYLEGFDKEEVMSVIDDAILADSWAPRIGWVVRQVIDRRLGGTPPPSEEDAWLEVESMMEAVSQGLPADTSPHPLVAEALSTLRKRTGNRVTKKAFEDQYRGSLLEHYRL